MHKNKLVAISYRALEVTPLQVRVLGLAICSALMAQKLPVPVLTLDELSLRTQRGVSMLYFSAITLPEPITGKKRKFNGTNKAQEGSGSSDDPIVLD